MKTKWIIGLMSVLFIVGFSVNASAVFTGVGDPDDSKMDPYEIVDAAVEIGPGTGECSSSFWIGCAVDGDCPGAETCGNYAAVPDHLKVCLKMDGQLPGVIIIDLDVDNDSATGGTSGMVSLFDACADGQPVAPDVAGTDIAITMVLTKQDEFGCSLQWCNSCTGEVGVGFKRDVQCDGTCVGGANNCWQDTTGGCNALQQPCYQAGAPCVSGSDPCTSCFDMTEIYGSDNDCNFPMIRGEWHASPQNPSWNAGTQSWTGPFQMGPPYHARGRIEMPLPPEGGPAGTDDFLCVQLPYARILDTLQYHNEPFLGNFDIEAAKDAQNTSWRIGVLEDGDPGGCDYIETSGGSPCLHVVDAVPNSGLLPAGTPKLAEMEYLCEGDFDKDGDVDGDDTTTFLTNLGRSSFSNPCCRIEPDEYTPGQNP